MTFLEKRTNQGEGA